MYCDTTIAAMSADVREELFGLFNTDNFVVELSTDVAGVELGGALKNIIAIAAGVVDGLGYGNNTKAAVIRAGLIEMIKFGSFKELGHVAQRETFLGSAGVGDLITTCFGGRNRMFGEQLGRLWRDDPKAARSVSLEQLEADLLRGQKVQGAHTAEEVYAVLKAFGLTNEFQVFTSVYDLCCKRKDPRALYRHFRDRDTEVLDVVKFFNGKIGPYAAHLSEKYGHDYKFKAAGKKEAIVSADPSLLKTVVTRILFKAFRHTKPGGAVAVTISTTGESLTVNVHNEGKGISEAQMAAANKKMAGAGAIISRFGGIFYVKSDKGAVDMGFTLPRA
jgi:hypothetical protein